MYMASIPWSDQDPRLSGEFQVNTLLAAKGCYWVMIKKVKSFSVEAMIR